MSKDQKKKGGEFLAGNRIWKIRAINATQIEIEKLTRRGWKKKWIFID